MSRSTLPRRALGLVALALLAAVLAARIGRAPLLFDALALGQSHLSVAAGALAAGALALRSWRTAAAGALAAGLALASTPALWTSAARPAAEGPTAALTVATANLNFRNARLPELTEALLALDADLLVTQETPEALLAPEGRLAATYPHLRWWRHEDGPGALAIWSRLPFAEPAERERQGSHPQHLFATVALPGGGRLQVMAVHMGWDRLRQQEWTLQDFNRFWPSMRPPTLVAGDFNAAPSSAALRRVADITRTEVLGGYRPTWTGGSAEFPLRLPAFAGLPVDHLLVSPGIGAEGARTADLPGSDHRAVAARLIVPDRAP